MPAVRAALERQNEAARAGTAPPIGSDVILAIAQDLLARVNLAAWLDRAESAATEPSAIPLRELRQIVAAANAVDLDEHGRHLYADLREVLSSRQERVRRDWERSIENALKDSRTVLDGLQRSARPPLPLTRFPAPLAVALSDAASRAMTAETDPESWIELLEAVLSSPVRRTVKPVGIPHDASGQVQAAARRAAGQVPALAKLLGMAIPPPPAPGRSLPPRTHAPEQPHEAQPPSETPQQASAPQLHETQQPHEAQQASAPASGTSGSYLPFSGARDDAVTGQELGQPLDQI